MLGNRTRSALAASLALVILQPALGGVGPEQGVSSRAVLTAVAAGPPGYGSAGPSNQPIVGIASTPDGGGYWLVAADGGVFTFGDANFYGSAGAIHLSQPVVGMAATPDGRGYWLVASDGGIFSYGTATFFGSAGSLSLQSPIAGMAPTPDGGGYWLAGADGGVFTFGNAAYVGGLGGAPLPSPVVGVAPAAAGGGYAMVDASGNTYSYGRAPSDRTVDLIGLSPAVAIAVDPAGIGFWVVAADGVVVSRANRFANGSTGDPAGNEGFASFCDTGTSYGQCLSGAVAALDGARHADGLNGVQLPAGFLGLSPAEQLFVLVDEERLDRAVPVLAGLTDAFDADAQEGADQRGDPSFAPDQSFTAGGSIWSGAQNPIQSIELWMYEDGVGFNGDCQAAGDPGCWGHRQDILLPAPAPPSYGLAGAAHDPDSDAMVIEVGTGQAPQPIVYSWLNAAAAGAT